MMTDQKRRPHNSPAHVAVKSRLGELKLILAEVDQYLAQVRAYLAGPSPAAAEELRHKAAYISSLALALRHPDFEVERDERLDEPTRRLYRGLGAVTSSLHRIAELALNVVRQFGYLRSPDFLNDYGLADFFNEIDLGLSMIRPALKQRKLKLAVSLCQVEERLDALYADRFGRLIQEMDQGLGRPGDRVTTLMIVHYLERIGDLILEIGEELIYIILGENLKLSQYLALEAGLKASGAGLQTAGDFQSIWGGRSGCRLGVVGGQEMTALGQPVFFKHGPAAKLEKERDNLETWAGLWPGLPPAVRAFVPAEGEGAAALVLEYIPGQTLKDAIMTRGEAAASRELAGVLELAAGLWRQTRRETECRAWFARQAEKRLGPIRALYPDLVNFSGAVGRLKIRSLESLLAEAGRYERNLPAPFTVRIHGDFNLSNIMCHEAGGPCRLVDFYRSRLSDYTQDLSVLILSLLRLPLAGSARARLTRGAEMIWAFAARFAADEGDPTVEARLTFGLARSFLTSARFEPHRSVAARFLGYSRHLWTSLVEYGAAARPWEDFRLDKRAFYV
jgi:Ser/Thr protein kinase RdoA (MazF antagonist)